MRGIILLPQDPGLKELTYYIGKAAVAGTNDEAPIVPLRVNRDADFVAKRMWLMQFGIGADTDAARAGTLPPRSTVKLVDGTTQRSLSLLGGFNRAMLNDCAPSRATSAWLGLPSPYLIRNNNNVFAEVVNPGAAGTPWQGDLYFVLEGHKIYPNQPETIPRTIEAYSLPYALNTNKSIAQPTLAAGNLNNQIATITNNGEGKFLAKGFDFQIIDANGVDRTQALLPIIGFQVTDTTSGTKEWMQNQTANVGRTFLPGAIFNMHSSTLPFSTPRFIDENGVIQVGVNFADNAASLVYAATFNWPMQISVVFHGSLLPR